MLPLARDAVRAAHAALSRLSLSGQPMLRLEDHEISVIGPAAVIDSLRGIDGDSLALPAALAFASLWLDRPLPQDLAATGAISRIGTTVERVGPSAICAKAEALARWAGTRSIRFIVPGANSGPARAHTNEVAVDSLAQALHAAGLSLQDSRQWQALGDVVERVAALELLSRDFQAHNLHPYRVAGLDPWLVLGDRLSLLAQSLQASPQLVSESILAAARAHAAMAYTHAGDPRGARDFPADLKTDASTPPPIRAFTLLSQLVAVVGTGDIARCLPLMRQLDDALETLRPDEQRWMLGLARGTQGRAWMHARDIPRPQRLAKALPLLRAAVEHHSAVSPHETPRSRIYLAMALRMNGQLTEADQQLRAASAELDTITAAWSGSYYRATAMYLAYERARLRLVGQASDDDLRAALEDTSTALAEAEERGGFWPAVGILRTRAWAEQRLGLVEDADRTKAMARELATLAPSGADAIVRRIIAELDSTDHDDGEAY